MIMKSHTQESLQADIENHPDRGMVNGKKVVNSDPREVRAKISSALKRKLLRVAGCYGMDVTQVVEMAIAALWRQEHQAVESHEQSKALDLGVSTSDIQFKTYGHYKDVGRRKRLNFTNKDHEQIP